MNTLITIGISCYNIAPYLPRAIDSVRAQTYPNLEILIVDDGSTDGSGAVCDEYAQKDDRIRVIHQENKGPGIARNRVMEEMKGRWLQFVDGDDYIEPDMVETMLSACFEADAPLAICRYVEECESAGVSVPVPHDAPSVAQILSRDTLLTLYIEEDDRTPIRNAVWNKLIRKDLVESLRMPGQMYYEDILFTARLLAAADKAVFVDRPLYHYIIDREDSIMNKGANAGIVTDQIPSYQAREEFLRSIGREDLACTEMYLTCKKLLALYAETVWPYRGRKKVLSAEETNALRNGITDALKGYADRMEDIYACRIADPHERFKMRTFLTHPVCYRLFTMLNDGFIRPARGL